MSAITPLRHGARRGPTACIGARAVALVNRAIRDEFRERFNVQAVHYIPMYLSSRNGLIQVHTISGPLARVRRMHLHTEYIPEHSNWHGLTADGLSVPVLLSNLMADCGELTELMCTFEGGIMPFKLHRKIVEVVEGLPKLRRYVINTGHIKSWAKRTSAKVGWGSPMAESVTHIASVGYGPGFGGEWRDFVANMSPKMFRRIF